MISLFLRFVFIVGLVLFLSSMYVNSAAFRALASTALVVTLVILLFLSLGLFFKVIVALVIINYVVSKTR